MADILQPPPRENVLIEMERQQTVLPGKPTIPWSEWFDLVWGMFTSVFITSGGRRKAVTVINSDTTLTETNHVVLCDTDGGAFTVTLPSGVDGTEYEIKNVGSSNNDVTLSAPEAVEDSTIYDSEAFQMIYEDVEKWVIK